MTSSEPDGAGTPDPSDAAVPAPLPAPPPDLPVLAQGHLHPAILFLRFLDGVRRMAFLVVVGLLVNELFLILALLPFLMQMLYGLAAYLSVQYRLTRAELVVRDGILHRQERRIPVDRIQDLAFEATLLRRALGLVVVRVETASGKAAEATLDSLGRAAAAQLREVLHEARAARGRVAPAPVADGEADEPAPAEPEPAPRGPEYLVHRCSPGALVIRGITDLRAGAILVIAFTALEIADQLELLGRLRGFFGSLVEWLGRMPMHLTVLLFLAVAAGVLAFGAVSAVVSNVVQFWNFTLTLRDSVLQRRYGLLTTRQKTLPLRRIQRVTTEASWLRRPFGFCAVRADSASSGFTEAEDQKTGWDLVVPLARAPEALQVVEVLLPGCDATSMPWRRVSPRLVGRMTLEGLAAALVLTAGLWWWISAWALLGFLVVPFGWVMAELTWRNFAWASPQGFLALRRGLLGRYQAFIPLQKVQAVILEAGPLDRLFGLAAVTVHVAGGSPTTLANLTRGDAEGLRAMVAGEAVQAARADWAHPAAMVT